MGGRTSFRAGTLVLAAFAAFGVLAAAGCNVVGPMYAVVHGPEKVPALHTLDDKTNTVVFIDDRASRIPRRDLRRLVGSSADQHLLTEKAVTEGFLIDSGSAIALAGNEKYGQPMGVAQLGRELGADVVVYITVDRFSLSPDGVTFAPHATVRMKVIDAAAEGGDRLIWPHADQGWHTINTVLPNRQGTMPTELSTRNAAFRALAETLGRDIARVFFKHVPKVSDADLST